MRLTLDPAERQRLATTPPFTVAEMVRARANDDRIGLVFEDSEFTHREVVEEAARRARLALEFRRPGPFHIGVLLDNVPDFAFWLAGAALAGAALVPFNPTRRGRELEGDIAHMDCALLVTESRHTSLVEGLELPFGADRLFDVDSGEYRSRLQRHAGFGIPDVEVGPDDPFLYVFTSGSTGAPKACRIGHGRIVSNAKIIAAAHGLTADDRLYEAMPFFHSSILMSCWTSGWVVGARHVMRRKFSASNFLDDVRKAGATYFGYVGKPLAYILATPERPDDADNPLRSGQGNEASPLDVERFSTRFGCAIRDGYGSTEGGVTIMRTADTPFGALGRPYTDETCIVNAETLEVCAIAEFDQLGRLQNPLEAIGEIVDRAAGERFEGYYKNPDAEAARLRNGWFWSGDLGYQDAGGYIYFAGRNGDMIRVDGENLSTSVIERIMERDAAVVAVAAYAVPAADVGDELVVCMQPHPRSPFDPDAFRRFLDEQGDLGPKMWPKYVRVTDAMPLTGSQKLDRRRLRAEGLETSDPVWVRTPDRTYERLELRATRQGE
jgi:fatty-acyl-CoA synthase